MQHLEIYQETLSDLLAPDSDSGSYTSRLKSRQVTSSAALAAKAKEKGIDIRFDPRWAQEKYHA